MRATLRSTCIAVSVSLLLLPTVPAQTWTPLSPATKPPSRTSSSLAFDVNGRGVLFGGTAATTTLGDTWLWNGTTWTQVSLSVAPPARDLHAMAYDEQRREIVLFGGRDSAGNPLNDTWVWDGTNWAKKTPASSPSARYGHLMAYDPIRRQTILIGSAVPGSIDGQTWAWDGTNWTRLDNGGYPNGPGLFLGWDASRQALVLFTPYFESTLLALLWNGSSWVQIKPTVVTQDVSAGTSHKGKLLLTGTDVPFCSPPCDKSGKPKLGQTFRSDGATSELLAANPTTPTSMYVMAYDAARDRTIALANDDGGISQTWSFDLGVGCAFPVSAGSKGGLLNLPGNGGTATLDVSLPSGCAWSATPSDPWILASPTSGSGAGQVSVSAGTNATFASRSGFISISGRPSQVTQDVPPCETGSTALPAGPFTVRAACRPTFLYTAAAGEQITMRATGRSNVPFVGIWNANKTTLLVTTSYTPATTESLPGSGTYTFPAAGTYLIEVGINVPSDDLVTVDYLKSSSGCTPNIYSSSSPATVPAANGAGSAANSYVRGYLNIGLAPGCPNLPVSSAASWLIVSKPTFITSDPVQPISSVAPGFTPVALAAEPNNGAAPRSTTISIGSTTIPVTQSGSPCGFTLSSNSRSVDSGRTAGSLTLTSAPQSWCSWTAASSAPWLQVYPLTQTGGAASSSVTYTVFPNFGTKTRSATLTIAGQTFTITQSPGTGTAMERFVRLLYFNFFGRLPSAAELAFQANSGLPREQLALNFFNSQEFTNGGRMVAGLYVGLLNRDAEYGGWLFQRDALMNGVNTPVNLINNFLISPEFALKNGPYPSDSDFVKLLYRQILLREPTQAEVNFQMSVLTGGGARSVMAYSFLVSQEFVIGTGPRLVAFLSYAGLLQRDPAATEFTAAKGMSLANLLTGIVNSAELGAILD